MEIQYLTAICFTFDNKPMKYRSIRNRPRQVKLFEEYCGLQEIMYINYYCKETRKFHKRKYRQPGGSFESKI